MGPFESVRGIRQSRMVGRGIQRRLGQGHCLPQLAGNGQEGYAEQDIDPSERACSHDIRRGRGDGSRNS